MLRGDEIWCQGMSEPDAGSDLASLRTAARAEGDTFVVSGQKTWNSLGRYADWCQLYVRTDPEAPKHKGISCLLVDMSSPGITVRPLRTMSGDFIFSELFFDDVVVPRSSSARPAQRGVAGGHDHPQPRAGRRGPAPPRPVRPIRGAARGGPPARADHATRCSVTGSPVSTPTSPACGTPRPGSWPRSAGAGSRRRPWVAWPSWPGPRSGQQLAELAVSMLGPGSAPRGPWAKALLMSPSYSIAGGTGDINRNVVAEHGLGLAPVSRRRQLKHTSRRTREGVSMTATWGYEGRRVIVSGGGGAGMGAAAVRQLSDLGAEVHVLDLKEPPVEVASYQAVDLRDPDATAAAVEAHRGHRSTRCSTVPGWPGRSSPTSTSCWSTSSACATWPSWCRPAWSPGRPSPASRPRPGPGYLANIGKWMPLVMTARLRRGQGMVRGPSRGDRRRVRTLQGGDHHLDVLGVVRAGRAGHPRQLHQSRARPTRR